MYVFLGKLILLFYNSIGLDYIKSHLEDQPMVRSDDTSQSSDEDDFFSTINRGSEHDNSKQLESYLANPNDTIQVLKSYKAVCQLSLKLNTPLPASAACDRLFSTAGMIFRSQVMEHNLHSGSVFMVSVLKVTLLPVP